MDKIMIGTPCYSGTVTINYLHSVLGMTKILQEKGIDVKILTTAHDSLIPRARNYIANEFLQAEEYSHLLFIDSDIGFPPEIILRFLAADKDVTCGIYPLKQLNIQKLRSIKSDVPDEDAASASLLYTAKFKAGGGIEDGFASVTYGSTGFMLIKRHVLKHMAEAFPSLRYANAYVPVHADQTRYAFFDTAIDHETGEYLPEDYAFCRRWTSIGGEVHADLLSRFSHVGQYVYTGDFSAFVAHVDMADQERHGER